MHMVDVLLSSIFSTNPYTMKFIKDIKNTKSYEFGKEVNTTTTTVKHSKGSLDVNIIKDTDLYTVDDSGEFPSFDITDKNHFRIKEYYRKDRSEILEIKIEQNYVDNCQFVERKKAIRINITKLLQLSKDQLNDIIQLDYYDDYFDGDGGLPTIKHVGKVKSK